MLYTKITSSTDRLFQALEYLLHLIMVISDQTSYHKQICIQTRRKHVHKYMKDRTGVLRCKPRSLHKTVHFSSFHHVRCISPLWSLKPPAFHVEIPTSGGVSVVFPTWIREIPTSESRAQTEPHKFCCLDNKSASGLQWTVIHYLL